MEAQKVERSNAARYGVRRVSWQGIASSILLIIQIILLFSAVYLSYLAEGKGGLIVGILGVAAFVLAIVSVGLSIWGLLKKRAKSCRLHGRRNRQPLDCGRNYNNLYDIVNTYSFK